MTVAIPFDGTTVVDSTSGAGVFSTRDILQTPGAVFYVGSNVTGAADAAGMGLSPDRPFATLAYAKTQCTSGRGDTIVIFPSHTETLSSATGAAVLTLAVANLTIIGLGRSTRPAFLIDGHANNYINITGADTTIVNCTFKSGHADVAKGISVAAAGVTFDGCHFLENTTAENFLFAIQTTAAGDEMLVENCKFISIDAAADAAIQIVGACNGVIIRNNYFSSPFVTSAIEAITNACLDMQIYGNRIYNSLNTGDDLAGAVDLVASSTGIIADNRIYHGDDTDCLTSIDGGNCGKAGNLAANEFAEEGGVAATQST